MGVTEDEKKSFILKLSRLSWSTARQPISFMSRSISARRFLRAFSTPA
jgi:hypothetical protein